MADQVQHFPCTIPRLTPKATPVTVPMQLGEFRVDWVEVDIPAGFNSQVGFFIASSGVQVIPFRSGVTPIWLVLNNTSKHWDLTDHPTSGDWSLVGYNLGNFPHTVKVSWGLTNLADAPGVVNLIPAASLSG